MAYLGLGYLIENLNTRLKEKKTAKTTAIMP